MRACTGTRGSCCARSSSGRPIGSSPCSRSGTARCGRSPRGSARPTSKFGARLEPTSHVAFQCYRGRELDVVTQVETIEANRAPARGLRAAHARGPDARSRRPGRAGAGAEPGALPHAHRRAAHARRAPQPARDARRSSGSCSRSRVCTRCSTAARAAATTTRPS